MENYKVFYVEWIDAVSESGWQKIEDLDDAHLCTSIGFLVKETKLAISLAATRSGKEVNCVQTIPKAWIKKKKQIGLKNGK